MKYKHWCCRYTISKHLTTFNWRLLELKMLNVVVFRTCRHTLPWLRADVSVNPGAYVIRPQGVGFQKTFVSLWQPCVRQTGWKYVRCLLCMVTACWNPRQSLARRSVGKVTICAWDCIGRALGVKNASFSSSNYYNSYSYKCLLQNSVGGTGGSAVGWGTALQTRRSRVRFPMVSLEFFIDIILLASLWSRNISWRVRAVSALGWQS
jgi:hypothetical protein